jgi:hypothetical protein
VIWALLLLFASITVTYSAMTVSSSSLLYPYSASFFWMAAWISHTKGRHFQTFQYGD